MRADVARAGGESIVTEGSLRKRTDILDEAPANRYQRGSDGEVECKASRSRHARVGHAVAVSAGGARPFQSASAQSGVSEPGRSGFPWSCFARYLSTSRHTGLGARRVRNIRRSERVFCGLAATSGSGRVYVEQQPALECVGVQAASAGTTLLFTDIEGSTRLWEQDGRGDVARARGPRRGIAGGRRGQSGCCGQDDRRRHVRGLRRPGGRAQCHRDSATGAGGSGDGQWHLRYGCVPDCTSASSSAATRICSVVRSTARHAS